MVAAGVLPECLQQPTGGRDRGRSVLQRCAQSRRRGGSDTAAEQFGLEGIKPAQLVVAAEFGAVGDVVRMAREAVERDHGPPPGPREKPRGDGEAFVANILAPDPGQIHAPRRLAGGSIGRVPASRDDLLYCRRRTVRFDPDRAAVIMFQPAALRPALYALHAFNLEIAGLRETVTEPALGAMRLQWWREALADIPLGRVRAHQVVRPLAEAVRAHRLPPASFVRLVDAREADLGEAFPDDIAAYARDTGGMLARLSALVRDGGEAGLRRAEDVGTAWALIGTVRAAAWSRRPLPGGTDARAIVSDARRLLSGGRGTGYAAGLATLAAAYLRGIERAGCDVADPALARPLALRGWRIAFGGR